MHLERQTTIMVQNHLKYNQDCSPLLHYRFAYRANSCGNAITKPPALLHTGKERDSETGFSYFGARYYDSDMMTGWLSVDPMADKYPGLSPYAYCAWNPIRLVDPDGEFPIGVHKETVMIAFLGSNLDSHAKDKIIYGAGIHSDVLHAPFSSIHLDNLCGFDNIKERYESAIADYNNNFMNCDYIAAGMNLHTIADFYAHSNYVDLYSQYASANGLSMDINEIPTFSKIKDDDNFREFVNANGGLRTGTFSILGWLSEKLFNIPPKEGSHSLVNLDDEFSPNGKQPYSSNAKEPTKYAVARALAQREINNLVNGENQ